MGKLVSVIVTTWNSYALTKQCLESISSRTSYSPLELIVVDNGSRDGSIQKLEKEFRNARFIKNRSNKGFPYALNQGYREAKGHYIAYLNNDAFVTEGWLESLMKTLDSDERIAVAGVKEVFPHQFKNSKFVKEARRRPNREKLTLPVGWMTKKGMITEIGFLDAEHFSPIYGEEADWNFRARSRGYKIIECSACIVVHFSSKDSGKAISARNHYILLNTHRLRSFFFNLGFFDLLRFVPGMGLIFLQSIKDGRLGWLLRAYLSNLREWKMILGERRKRKKSAFIPFREPKFTPPFKLEW